MVIAGHTRLKAARLLGMKEVLVRYLDLSRGEAEALALADNKLGELAEWSDDLAAILSDLQAEDIDIQQLGWDASEIGDILGDVPELDADPFANLPTEAPEFRTMTFTLTVDQVEQVEQAIRKVRALGHDFTETGNTNGNGNALAFICEVFDG